MTRKSFILQFIFITLLLPQMTSGQSLKQLELSTSQALVNNQFDSAVFFLRERHLLLLKLKQSGFASDLLDSAGILLLSKSRFLDAEKHFNESLNMRLQLGDTSRIAQSYRQLGGSAGRQRDNPLALSHFEKYLKYSVQMKDSLNMGRAYNNLGLIAIRLGDFKGAKDYLHSALKIKKGLGESIGRLSNTYNNLGLANENLNLKDSAIYYYELALNIRKELKDVLGQSKMFNNIGFVYQKVGMRDTAIHLYFKALPQANDDLRRKLYSNISSASRDKGNWKMAYEYLFKYDTLNERMFNEFKVAQIAELRTQFDLSVKEQQIASQRLEIQEATIRNKKLQNIFLISLLVVVVVIATLIHRQRIIKVLAEKDREVHRNEIEVLLKNLEMKSIDSMIEGQEKERERIAEDLHDRLGNTLSAIRIYMDTISQDLSDKNSRIADKIKELVDRAIDETRQISHNLLSGVLTKFGLVAALRDLKETIEGTNKVRMTVKTIQFDQRMELEKEVNLYRIVQESISNVLRHAQASLVQVELKKREDNLVLRIIDNGIGMNDGNDYTGIGLKNIQARVDKIGGVWELASEAGRGTTVEINIKA